MCVREDAPLIKYMCILTYCYMFVLTGFSGTVTFMKKLIKVENTKNEKYVCLPASYLDV